VYKKEEEKLNEFRNSYDDIQVPLEFLDEAIMTGFQKAKTEGNRKPRSKKWAVSLMFAAIIFLGFFTSIRLSPAFASYVAVIPGMEKVVELIRWDKGRLLAVENDYYQEIGVSQEKNGLEIKIDGAIADENGLVLFYTIQSEEKQKDVTLDVIEFNRKNGEKLNWSSASLGSHHDSEEGETSYQGTLEYFFDTPLPEKEFELGLKITSANQTENYKLTFQLKKDIKSKKTYKINKTAVIEGQKMTFLEADIYPLRAAIHVKMDPNNSKKLLSFEDLRLVDENGEVWNKIANGITASNISEDEAIIYLQSNYFKNPKELYLVINKIQAVDKDEAYVVVDTEKKQILKKPQGNQLNGFKVTEGYLIFNLQTEHKFNAFLFGRIKDSNGNEITPQRTEMSDIDGGSEIRVNIHDLSMVRNPISLELTFFPKWIVGEEKVRIK
jgi:hypothetical protein